MAFSGALVSTSKFLSSAHSIALIEQQKLDINRLERLHHTISSMH